MMPMQISDLHDVNIQMDSVIEVSEDYMNWPNKNEKDVWDFITITDSTNLHIKGNGTVSGNGYWWWVRDFMR